MINTNPIQGLYDEYMKIIQRSVIKYSYLADAYEDLEMRKYVDGYLDAYYQRDTFELYTYREDEYVVAGVNNPSVVYNYMINQKSVPKSLQEKLLQNRRQEIIDGYVEKNEYYRMLNGLPSLNENEFIYPDYDICIEYGINPSLAIHEIEDVMGSHYINILESIGYLDQIIKENPDKEYLQYIGSRRIDILSARQAKNFEILYLDSSISESIRNIFITVYEQCREYFTTTIYMFAYRKLIDYYDRFIGLCIMVMALQQLTARSLESSIDRDFFDSNAVQALYEMYAIPFYSKLDEGTQKSICQNINMLIKNKGTNKVIYDIASLLGFDRIEIYRYYLMKEHILDSDGNPIFITKEVVNEDTGELETTYDYEKMFDIYFQKVKLNDYDYLEELDDKSNRVSYDSLTSGDPYWFEDADLFNEIWKREYNYKESKYLGVTVSYKLTELLYENILLFRLLFDNKDSIQSISLKLPSISGDIPVSLFDTITLLCALTSKKYGLNGEIVSKPSQIIQVLSDLERLYHPYDTMNETFAFNFKWLKETSYDNMKCEFSQYMDGNEINEFEKYLSVLTITGSSNNEKITAINQMYRNVKGLSKFLSNKITKSKTVEEYRVMNRFFRALYYSKETAEMFGIKDSTDTVKTASTFLEYLKSANPSLGEFVENVDRDECHMYIDHIITRLEEIIVDLQNLYLINNSTSSLQDVLVDLIRFFKSYTTDMIGLNIVYIFDFLPDNIIKFFDCVDKVRKNISIKERINLDYADAIHHMHVLTRVNDNINIKDTVRIHSLMRLSQYLSFKDCLSIIKYIDISDIMKLIDNIYVHATVHNSDKTNLIDLISYIHSTKVLDQFISFLDRLSIKKKNVLKDSFIHFDAISKINKELDIGDINMKFSDKCIVIRR